MRDYPLNSPMDADGQPLFLFKANAENNAAKALHELAGICRGILADGIVNELEAKFFYEWIQKVTPLQPIWPLTDVLARVQTIFADGVCDEQEREELREVFSEICGNGSTKPKLETLSSDLPLDEPMPIPITFSGMLFSITGKFAFGARKNVARAIEERGGAAKDGPPTAESNYLVIGVFASRDWKYSHYGRKIERAVELRNKGCGISIISEEHWKRFLG